MPIHSLHFFFFQVEDGIRDKLVTGVQTCALPISLGVQVWTNSRVTNVLDSGVSVGNEHVAASTVLWAAGVRAADVGRTLGVPVDQVGRVNVGHDLTIAGHPEVFVLGDLARFEETEGKPLPGVALVAMQEGIYAADVV